MLTTSAQPASAPRPPPTMHCPHKASARTLKSSCRVLRWCSGCSQAAYLLDLLLLLQYWKVLHLYHKVRASTGVVAVASPLPENHCQPVRSCVQESAPRPVPLCRDAALCCSWQRCRIMIMRAATAPSLLLPSTSTCLKKYNFFHKEITSCLVAPQEPVGRTLALCPATHLQGELVRLSQQHKVCLGFGGYRGWGLDPCYVPPGRAGAAESTAQDVSRVSGLWLGGCLPSISTVL